MPYTPDDVLLYVPYLRRHARLLTGSKEVGDEYVRLCLELITAEPERLDGDDLRVQLFAAFHAAWSALHAPAPTRPTDPSDRRARLGYGIAKLAPLERRVLLLASVEDLPLHQVGRVLGIGEGEARELLGKARLDLSRHTAARALIIEDEAVIAMELSEILSDMGLTVAAAVTGQQEAVDAAVPPLSLVLADIQLEGNGSGIIAAREILERYDVPIVFVTGFPERLLTGDGLEPAFVVAKPFTEASLKTTIAQALDLYDAPENALEHRTRLLAKLQTVSARELRGLASISA